MRHFFQRGSNQTTQSDHIHFFFNSTLHNGFRRHHHSQVYNIITIASHHHRYNIFSNIVHIALYSCQQHFSSRGASFHFFRFDNRLQDSYGFFHRTGSLHNLGKEHFTGTKQLAYIIHSIHQRAFNHIDCFIIKRQCFRQILFKEISDSFHQGIFQAFLNGFFSPRILFGGWLSGSSAHSCFQRFRQFYQTFRSVRTTIQDDIFYLFQYIGRDITI